MKPRNSCAVAAVSLTLVFAGCSDNTDEGSPTAPTPTSTSLSVTFPPGGPIFIGRSVQFEARETLSNGTTRVATTATWGSDAPSVATVSPTGLVTAVSAGEATIFADVNPRGTLRIRVLPNFGGSWGGSEVLTSCDDSEDFEGFCEAVYTLGEVFRHSSTFTQTEASVDAEINLGGGVAARGTGTIAMSGELQLPSMPGLPADPDVNLQAQNWRSRVDVPSQMTGMYEGVLTVPGVAGSVRLGLTLQNVVSTSAASTALRSSVGGGTMTEQVRQWLANHP